MAWFGGSRKKEAEGKVLRVGTLSPVQVPLLPLLYGPSVVVCAWRVKTFEPSPLGLPSLAAVDVETG